MIAKKPPMGWNSWNTFGDKINEQLIKEMTDRIVEDGYRDLGYEYVIIDDDITICIKMVIIWQQSISGTN